MGTGRLRTYLKSARKRAGLSQLEIEFLLGDVDDTLVSKYESGSRVPPLEVALALQEIFKIPINELFAGLNQSVAAEVAVRIRKFSSEIQSKSGGKNRKLRQVAWLDQCHGLPGPHDSTISCTC